MSKLGRVAWDRYRGWHVEFRAVQWPGAELPRRVRVTRAPGIGRLDTEDLAQRALTQIQQRAMERPLPEVLAEYLDRVARETTIPYRWEHDYLPALAVRVRDGDLSAARYRNLAAIPQRGYLRFWSDCPVGRVTRVAIEEWYHVLRQGWPHLRPVTVHGILVDFRGFLRHMASIGAIESVPPMPRVRVPRRQRRVPDRESLRRILDAIPEADRGLFLARSLAGLRPQESILADVGDYQGGRLYVRAEKAKTARERVLEVAVVAPELDAWIRRHRAGARPWEPLFPSSRAQRSRAGRWSRSSAWNAWAEACRAAGLEHVPPNAGGRHAFGTLEVSEGGDVWAVSRWMGHSSVQTTERYVHADSMALARRLRPRVDQSRTRPKTARRNTKK